MVLLKMEINQIYLGDCLELMPEISDGSVDMILADLPYGTTACKWDSIIPFEPLWKEYKRIIKPNGAIVLTASQPFTSALVMSNPTMFKHEWIWKKNVGGNFLNCNKEPMKEHESVVVFGEKGRKIIYNQQRIERKEKNRLNYFFKENKKKEGEVYGNYTRAGGFVSDKETRVPSSVLYFNRESGLHPTQKPVALFEYLIKTYSNENDVILDNTAGSGTTAIAAINTDRRYILIEKEAEYIEVCNKRIEEALQRKQMV